MKVVNAGQMRDIERRYREGGGSLDDLMERAGREVASGVRRLLNGAVGQSIIVLVGPGNNGADGLVAARHLRKWGADVRAFVLAPRPADDPKLRLAVQAGVEVVGPTDALPRLEGALSPASLVLDAVLGIGKARPLEGTARQALTLTAQARRRRPDLKIVALDLPSGLDADTGAADPATLPCDVTITLGYPKPGLLSFPGAGLVGRLDVADIGLPEGLASDITTELITPELVRTLLPTRPRDANKGTFGKTLVVAGSINYIGAAYLACAAAGRIGAGLLTLATPQSLLPILASKLTETTFLPLPEAAPGVLGPEADSAIQQRLSDYNALLVGPGLGQHPATAQLVSSLLLSPSLVPPVVLDADALNTLAGTPEGWKQLKVRAVLTPHPGEMSRLTGIPVARIQEDRLAVAGKAAQEWGQVVVLKGAFTVVAVPSGQAWISPWANPALASAGTGDVLAGAIVGLLAQGLGPEQATIAAVYLHGLAGEMAAQAIGEVGVVASDLLPLLPKARRQVKST